MHVSERLRQLRERAGLTKTELAKALGYKHLGAYHFEDPGRKADFLPVPKVVRLIQIMRPHGIGALEIMELAGFPAGLFSDAADTPPNSLNPDYVRTVASALLEYAKENNLDLSPEDQADIIVKFCSVYQSEVNLGREDPVLDKKRAKTLLRFSWSIRS